MSWVLHVHESNPDFQTLRAIEQFSRGLEDGFENQRVSIGSGASPATAVRGALRLRGWPTECDIVHAWGIAALSATALCRFRRTIFTPTEPLTRRQTGWLRAIMHYRDVQIVCPTVSLHREL